MKPTILKGLPVQDRLTIEAQIDEHIRALDRMMIRHAIEIEILQDLKASLLARSRQTKGVAETARNTATRANAEQSISH